MENQIPGATPDTSGALALTGASALFRQATDVAHVCREMVLRCVVEISERRYVRVEGWMSIAVAHGCIASIRSVENIPGEGVKCVAEVRRIADQAILATAEGFVGVDEPDWYGGTVTRLNRRKRPPTEETFVVKKRADHAIRAMAQTRAISRVLRAGFSHVVVMIDNKLETVPADEILDASDRDDDPPERPTSADRLPKEKPPVEGNLGEAAPEPPKKPVEVPRDEVLTLREQFRGRKWEAVVIHFGNTSKGKKLGELSPKSLAWWVKDWQPRPLGNRPISDADLHLRAALDVAGEECAEKEGDS